MGSPSPFACEHVSKAFARGWLRGRTEVLHDISLTLEPGECLGLVGPNGSGKTTLLRIAAGIESASSGTVALFGADGIPDAARRRIGYLSEDSPFPGELRARDALLLLARLSRMNKAGFACDAMLERVGLDHVARRRLSSFSKGMLRRFGLAQAFVHRPDLVLLDEPTAGLDAAGYLVLGELLDEARDRGAACVLSSHTLSDLAERVARLAVLVEGRLMALDSPHALVHAGARLRLEFEGLTPQALDLLERSIVDAGGRIVSRGPAQRTLLEIYRRPRTETG